MQHNLEEYQLDYIGKVVLKNKRWYLQIIQSFKRLRLTHFLSSDALENQQSPTDPNLAVRRIDVKPVLPLNDARRPVVSIGVPIQVDDTNSQIVEER